MFGLMALFSFLAPVGAASTVMGPALEILGAGAAIAVTRDTLETTPARRRPELTLG
jgi:hypothetical protein